MSIHRSEIIPHNFNAVRKIYWFIRQMPSVKRELTPGVSSHGVSMWLFIWYISFYYDREVGYGWYFERMV